MFDTTAECLCRDLRKSVQQDRVNPADGVFCLGLVARLDHEAVIAASDMCSVGDHMEGGAIAVRWEEANGVALWLALLPDLLGQTDWSEGAAGTKPLIVSDGRPFERHTDLSGLVEGGLQVGPSGNVDGDADSNVGSMIADTAFGDRLSERLLKENGVGDDLEPVGWPGIGCLTVVASRLAALVFVGEVGAIAPSHTIDLADQTEAGGCKLHAHLFALLIRFERRMQLPPSEDTIIGRLDALDFLKVEEAWTVGEGVQRFDPQRGFV
jgi:hypothetical protein